MANPVLLDGKTYTVAIRDDGSQRIVRTSRPSQPADAGALTYAEWQTWGHDLDSFERIGPGQEAGYLGRDWGEGTDGRWLGLDTLGPLINTIDQSQFDNPLEPGLLGGDATPGMILGGGATASGGGLGPLETASPSDSAATVAVSTTSYAYVNRGKRPAKIDLSDMTAKNSGLVLSRNATDIITTSPDLAGVGAEVSIAQGESTYVTVQRPEIGVPPITDGWMDNSAGEDVTVFGQAPDSAVGLHENNVKRNIMTGSVTMQDPNWQTVTSAIPAGITPTGFAVDGNLWVLGYTDGPYMLDSLTRKFFPEMEELSLSIEHCRNMSSWFPLGVVIPLEYALRYQRYGAGRSFGSETFNGNTSPVQGTPTAWAASEREGYEIRYNPEDGDAYLVAWREREIGDGSSYEGGAFSPYVIAKLTGKQSRYLHWLGTVDGLRTNPTLMGGYGSDSFWITCGRTARWIDDSNYRYAAQGVTYGTELRRLRNVIADVEFVEVEVQRSDGGALDANKAVTVQLAFDSGIEAGTYTAVGAPMTTAGFYRLVASSGGVPVNTFSGVHRMKPRWVITSNDSTVSPQVVGPLRVYYRTRPTEIVVQQITYILDGKFGATPQEQEDALRALIYDGPVEYQDSYSDTYYVRVTNVGEVKIIAKGQGRDSARGFQSEVVVTLETWTTS